MLLSLETILTGQTQGCFEARFKCDSTGTGVWRGSSQRHVLCHQHATFICLHLACSTVHSVALNPLGHKLMGSVPWPIARYPIVAENDFAGTIVDSNGHMEWSVGQGERQYLNKDSVRLDAYGCL